MDRQLMKDPKDLEEILVFSDGSLSFSGYLIYMVIREENGDKTMKLIRSGRKTQNSRVPVSEHIARTIGINVLYGILSVLHFHFGDAKLRFSFIGDSLCSSKLYRDGCDTTVKLSTNTRLQK